MPFKEVNIKDEIEKERNLNPTFKKAWDNSRMEYHLLGELIRFRKEQGLTQFELAKKSGNKQQVISRIEKSEQSPTLKTLCNLANALNFDIKFLPREH
ncbi:MAG: helix-turn-helix domain-containing protein [Oscillospiraceae bacterium]|nr:helix-turn-helix domain-containing protein [Oscillospiraceae bacterium]